MRYGSRGVRASTESTPSRSSSSLPQRVQRRIEQPQLFAGPQEWPKRTKHRRRWSVIVASVTSIGGAGTAAKRPV